MAQPAHILTPTVSVRGIVNMSALAIVEAQAAMRRKDDWVPVASVKG
jgi:malate dehydrogenase (oxaloacetate-decarboxylating)(NADP+)